MTEAVFLTNEELAILCDIVGGWAVKRPEKLDADKKQTLDRLIANGFVEPADEASPCKIPTHRQNGAAFRPALRGNKRRVSGRLQP